MWQCSSLHKLGYLFHSDCNSTPYQPVKLDNSNEDNEGVKKETSLLASLNKALAEIDMMVKRTGQCGKPM
jgi:hypothetical protein